VSAGREESAIDTDSGRRSVWSWFEQWLAGLSALPSPALFGAFLVWFVGWTVLVAVVLEQLVDPEDQPAMADVAGQLVPAVGVLFGLLTAFVITNQWNRTRTAEGVVGAEADAAVRFALATQSPGVDGSGLRALVTRYLCSVLDDEWPTLSRGRTGAEATSRCLAQLQRTARAEAVGPEVSPAVSADLLAAAAGVAVARRDRLNASGSGLPAALFLLTFVSGVVLCLTAIAMAVQLDDWVAIVIGGLVVLIALDLALVVAISDPYRGPLRVLPGPLEAVRDELAAEDVGPAGTHVDPGS
jgi:hypothetical protein